MDLAFSLRTWSYACLLVPFALGCSGTVGDDGLALDDGGGFHGAFDGGDGGDSGGLSGDAGASDGSTKCGSTLIGTIRDFKQSHPDFEYVIADDRGIVKTDLGSDGKPVYASSGVTKTTTGKASFDQWYRDTPGENITSSFSFTMTKGAGDVYTYDNGAFFPIDGKGWGNEGNPHNFHFTFELHTRFLYAGGETFKFTGDDDLWTFINGKLVIDLGGVHGAETDQVSLDTIATKLGLEKGKDYPLDIFSAERHTTESHFRVDTTLVFTDCGSSVK